MFPDLRLLVRVVLRWTIFVLEWLLVAPWLAGAFIVAALDAIANARRAFRAGQAAFADTVRCPRGHRSELHGIFECRCGALFAGWAFERCPVCAESCGWIGCEHCGLAVRNPVIVALER